MSDKDFKIPKSLVNAPKAGEVVPFVGAGVSMSVRKKNAAGTESSESLFPSWKGFVEILAQALRDEHNPDEAAYVLSSINIKKPKYLTHYSMLTKNSVKVFGINFLTKVLTSPKAKRILIHSN